MAFDTSESGMMVFFVGACAHGLARSQEWRTIHIDQRSTLISETVSRAKYAARFGQHGAAGGTCSLDSARLMRDSC